MNLHRITRTTALGLVTVAAAVAAPTASAMPDYGVGSTESSNPAAAQAPAPRQDMRSPDTRDVATAAESSKGGTSAATSGADLRSPDARDHAAGRGTFNAPEVTVVKVPEPAPVAPSNGGIDWGDVGIGAGGMLGLALLALGGTYAVVHRRHDSHSMITTG